MPSPKEETPRARDTKTVIVGLLTVVLGMFPMLIGLGILPRQVGDAPAWLGIVAGSIFILVGAAVVIRGAVNADAEASDLPASAPQGLRTLYGLLGWAAVFGLAVTVSWAAFGPGPRHFTASIPFYGGGPANELLGRVIFGFGALLVWACVIGLGLSNLRRLRSER
jgi:hypothetical protein